MTTATTTLTHIPAASANRGWFMRFLERVADAQLQVARKRVCQHLRTMSDDGLQQIGFTAGQIAELRAGHTVDFPD